MTVFETVKILCNERKISINELENALGYSKNTLYRLKTQTPGADKLQTIADYFDVSVDYLLGRTDKKRYYDLTEKDEQDIAKKLEGILTNMESDTALAFDGEPMDEETKALVRAAIESNLQLTKQLAKKKFTPKKYRK